MQICNVVKTEYDDVLKKLHLNNIKVINSAIIDFSTVDFQNYIIDYLEKEYKPSIYKKIKNNKNNKISKDEFKIIDDIYIDTIEFKKENIIVLDVELEKHSYFLEKLFEKLEDLNTTIILVSNKPLALKNKYFIKKYFLYQSDFDLGIKRLRNQIKKTLIRVADDTTYNEINKVKPRFGILKSYKTKNEESKKYYESYLNKPVSVLTMSVKNRVEVAISTRNDYKIDNEVFFNKVNNNFKTTTTLNDFIKKDNEFTFIISDDEMFTIEVPILLLNIEATIIDCNNFNLIYDMEKLYFEYGEDFIRYKDRDDIDSEVKMRLEKGLDEIAIKAQIVTYDNVISKKNQENKKG